VVSLGCLISGQLWQNRKSLAPRKGPLLRGEGWEAGKFENTFPGSRTIGGPRNWGKRPQFRVNARGGTGDGGGHPAETPHQTDTSPEGEEPGTHAGKKGGGMKIDGAVV